MPIAAALTPEAYTGRLGATMQAPDEINLPMIRHWCQAMGDTNSGYLDDAFATASSLRGIVAPAAMTQVWTMPPLGSVPPEQDAVAELYAELDSRGYRSIVATNSNQTYRRPQRLGDRLSATKKITDISAEKTTRLGRGRFVTTEIDIVDAAGHTVATQTHRVLKFQPSSSSAATAFRAPSARRPRPNVTEDTAFYFDAARQARLMIQRCAACGEFQHPPLPACGRCHSFDVRAAQVSGRGQLYSYTVVHAPAVEPFDPPYVVALVALDEGPRVVAGLVGVDRQYVAIGMALQATFTDFDAELRLPMFRPRTSRDDAPNPPHATVTASELVVGTPLPELQIPITRRLIVTGAIATRDFQPVHHDAAYAQAQGMPDIFTNIMTSQGLVTRVVTDWTGPEAEIRRLDLRLGASNFPGDLLTLRGRIAEVDGCVATISVVGTNSLGTHIEATLDVAVPQNGGAV